LWQEGIARYTEVKVAEAQQISADRGILRTADFEAFDTYAPKPRQYALNELKQVDLAKSGRLAVYPFGAAEGFLLDRINPSWKMTISSKCSRPTHTSY